jgi:5'-phosphate synthase pdxT subunit
VTDFGVMALQGDYAAHLAALARLDVPAREVRRADEVPGLAGLILPGGESTALLKLMEGEPWFETLAAFHERGGALLGTCAGAILLAREVWPSQPSLALLDASVERNAYGRRAALPGPGPGR